MPLAARRAHRVLTVSAASRDDIVRELRVAPERVEVVPNGIEPPARAGDAAAARARLEAGDRPVLLSVATDLPHKNLAALIDGLARLEPAERPLLAFAGHGTDRGELAAHARRLGVAADVRLLGAVARGDLEDLYAAADGLVTADALGGLRAAGAGGDGARRAGRLLRPPRPARGGRSGLAELLDPRRPRQRRRRRCGGCSRAGPDGTERAAAGRAHAARFTWAAAARATAAAYERAAAEARRGPSRPGAGVRVALEHGRDRRAAAQPRAARAPDTSPTMDARRSGVPARPERAVALADHDRVARAVVHRRGRAPAAARGRQRVRGAARVRDEDALEARPRGCAATSRRPRRRRTGPRRAGPPRSIARARDGHQRARPRARRAPRRGTRAVLAPVAARAAAVAASAARRAGPPTARGRRARTELAREHARGRLARGRGLQQRVERPGSSSASLLSSTTHSAPQLERAPDRAVVAAAEAEVGAVLDQLDLGMARPGSPRRCRPRSRCRRRPRSPPRESRSAPRQRSVSSRPFQLRRQTAQALTGTPGGRRGRRRAAPARAASAPATGSQVNSRARARGPPRPSAGRSPGR